MTQKPFEDLTISDDFMFCKVMEYESICKEFLEMLFTIKIEKITYLSSQNTVTTNSGAKTIRLDVLVKDDAGTSYNVEMCFPIDVRVYRKTRVLPFGKTSLLLEPAASMPLLKHLLQIGGVDARSVQKTPAGVLAVRRGLFFVKRQRRYPHIFKRCKKRLY